MVLSVGLLLLVDVDLAWPFTGRSCSMDSWSVVDLACPLTGRSCSVDRADDNKMSGNPFRLVAAQSASFSLCYYSQPWFTWRTCALERLSSWTLPVQRAQIDTYFIDTDTIHYRFICERNVCTYKIVILLKPYENIHCICWQCKWWLLKIKGLTKLWRQVFPASDITARYNIQTQ